MPRIRRLGQRAAPEVGVVADPGDPALFRRLRLHLVGEEEEGQRRAAFPDGGAGQPRLQPPRGRTRRVRRGDLPAHRQQVVDGLLRGAEAGRRAGPGGRLCEERADGVDVGARQAVAVAADVAEAVARRLLRRQQSAAGGDARIPALRLQLLQAGDEVAVDGGRRRSEGDGGDGRRHHRGSEDGDGGERSLRRPRAGRGAAEAARGGARPADVRPAAGGGCGQPGERQGHPGQQCGGGERARRRQGEELEQRAGERWPRQVDERHGGEGGEEAGVRQPAAPAQGEDGQRGAGEQQGGEDDPGGAAGGPLEAQRVGEQVLAALLGEAHRAVAARGEGEDHRRCAGESRRSGRDRRRAAAAVAGAARPADGRRRRRRRRPPPAPPGWAAARR